MVNDVKGMGNSNLKKNMSLILMGHGWINIFRGEGLRLGSSCLSLNEV